MTTHGAVAKSMREKIEDLRGWLAERDVALDKAVLRVAELEADVLRRRALAEATQLECNRLAAAVERLRDELTGKKAVERSKMRRYALSLCANLACPCGSVLQATQELDAHVDHMCNDESWRSAALRGEGEK